MLSKPAISSFFVGSAFEIKTHKILFFKGGTIKWKFVIVVARFEKFSSFGLQNPKKSGDKVHYIGLYRVLKVLEIESI